MGGTSGSVFTSRTVGPAGVMTRRHAVARTPPRPSSMSSRDADSPSWGLPCAIGPWSPGRVTTLDDLPRGWGDHQAAMAELFLARELLWRVSPPRTDSPGRSDTAPPAPRGQTGTTLTPAWPTHIPTVIAIGPGGAVVPYTVSVTDNVDDNPQLTCQPLSESTFPVGATTVTCTAADSSGNTATASFPVNVLTPLDLGLMLDPAGNATRNRGRRTTERFSQLQPGDPRADGRQPGTSRWGCLR